MPPDFTIDGLRAILRAAAGDDEYDVTGDVLDVPFEDLGYDSLAMLETAGQIKQLHGVDLDESAFAGAATPRLLIAEVNQHLTQYAR
jgi:act minimal PKS acyl carrier protein